jgi:hypothetical protein
MCDIMIGSDQTIDRVPQVAAEMAAVDDDPSQAGTRAAFPQQRDMHTIRGALVEVVDDRAADRDDPEAAGAV